MTCETCIYFEPLSDEVGALIDLAPGKCTYVVTWPMVPQSYYPPWPWVDSKPSWPPRRKMYKTDGVRCVMYLKKKKNP